MEGIRDLLIHAFEATEPQHLKIVPGENSSKHNSKGLVPWAVTVTVLLVHFAGQIPKAAVAVVT